ncbi:bifunctional 2-polyprenyl-6-hydroxyphenol methylase/3-demethylubiquinol 3-O-methyltransferase UbiG [Mucilaginibacter sp. OK283]|jgi:ubiquinone/menaquinone biosynthesis C-methylase UbiE|uniref:class I SAM-dependent methyltransferase n=1 Tax=Mucilaginibacter sp. OK283 TaxID=1881049 RepID=UPI0008B8A62D|nr:class I SAM-dependent methyltransferase [Mucilaginibacter sp. OK283]SEP37936.1 Methyltransferase domain-containing protein [Mucilaginibacter sp. OK283]
MAEKTPNWDGERLETFISGSTAIEHLHRYGIAQQLCLGKQVLDVASGEGYGSNLLAKVASSVTGVDISEKAISDAKKKYHASNLTFHLGSCNDIPLPENCVDVVVSFETIEHHAEHQKMLSEIKRVLRPDGILIISTPDKKNYSDATGYNNPFHVKELYTDEFRNLLKEYFANLDIYYQRILNGSLVVSDAVIAGCTHFFGDYENVSSTADFQAVYNIAIASNATLPRIGTSIFPDADVWQQVANDAINRVKASNSYRLGNFLLKPLSLFKQWTSKSR